jgi:hypothetical protein
MAGYLPAHRCMGACMELAARVGSHQNSGESKSNNYRGDPIEGNADPYSLAAIFAKDLHRPVVSSSLSRVCSEGKKTRMDSRCYSRVRRSRWVTAFPKILLEQN